jgi:hypothetical protein
MTDDVDREWQAMLKRGDLGRGARFIEHTPPAVSREFEPLDFRSEGARFWLELGDDEAR